MSDLEHRIAGALNGDAITSAALSELVQETETAIVAAEVTVEEERGRALDPLRSPDPKAAREAMQTAEFARDRLKTLLPRLQKHARHIAYSEAYARWRQSHEAVKVEHDAAVAELRQIYPELIAKLVPLLTHIRTIDAEARRVNERKPVDMQGEPYDGLPGIPMVECAARGLKGGSIGGQFDTRLSLNKDLVLPDFTDSTGTKKVWPPHEIPLGAQLAQAMLLRQTG